MSVAAKSKNTPKKATEVKKYADETAALLDNWKIESFAIQVMKIANQYQTFQALVPLEEKGIDMDVQQQFYLFETIERESNLARILLLKGHAEMAAFVNGLPTKIDRYGRL